MPATFSYRTPPVAASLFLLTLFRMSLFGAAHKSYKNETCHSYTLPTEDPKNI